MATPLIGSAFTPTDFDQFLNEVGLGDLPPDARLKLVDDLSYAVEYGVMTRVLQRLTPDQKFKLVDLMREAKQSGDYIPANNYVSDQIPDLEEIVDEMVERVKKQLRPGRTSIEAIINNFMDSIEKRKQFEESYRPLPVPEKPDADQSTEPDTAATESVTEASGAEAALDDNPGDEPATPATAPFPWETDPTLKAQEEADPDAILQKIQNTPIEAPAAPEENAEPDTDTTKAIDDELHAVE